MDLRGIDHAHLGSTDWSNVIGMRVVVHGESPVLLMGFFDPRAVRVTGLARFLPRRSHWRIPMRSLDVSSDRIQAAARSLRGRVEPPQVDGWFPGISPAQLELVRTQERLLAGLERLSSQPVDVASIAQAESLLQEYDRSAARTPRPD